MHPEQSKKTDPNLHFNQDLALKRFYESAPMMMGIADVVGDDIRHVSDNIAAAEYFGVSPEDMEGKLSSELGIPQSVIELWIENYRKAEKNLEPVNFEYSAGLYPERILSVSVSFIEISQEGFSRFSYIVRDVSLEKKAHEKLEALADERTKQLELEKNKLDCLLKAAPIGIAFVDKDLRYEVINPVLAKLNGHPVKDHIGRDIREILTEKGKDIAPVLKKIMDSGEGITNREFEDILPSDPKKTHYFIGNYFPVHLEDEVLGVGATIVDITDRKKIENELKASEALSREIANAMPQIVWTATPEGFVDWYNDRWYEFTGAKKGSHWDDDESPMHPDDIGPTHERWKEAVRTGEPYQMEYRFKRQSDGEYRWHLGRAMPVKDQEGNIIRWIGSNTEIHEQKQLVKKLESERDLREYFIATLTHDLRTPLTAAKMSAQLMARKSEDIAVNKSSMRIVENMDRADSMIQDLLDATRIKAGEKLPVHFVNCNLTHIAIDTINELSTIHGDRFLLNAKMHIEGHWSCKGLRRLLENLCSNAIKYGSTYSPVSVTINEEDTIVVIEVHNEGNPIPQEELVRLFEPFKRAETAQTKGHRGWGIGLTLVKGLVDAHNGKVSVTSSENDGTTFIVCLPKDPENTSL